MLVTHPSVPAATIPQLIALAKKSPGRLNYSSSGVGAMPHLAGALFVSMAKVDVVHIPYKGGAASLIDVIAGQCDMTIGTVPSVQPHVKAGKVRALGVTGRKRARMAPEVPTIAEAGLPGYELASWYGVFAPAGIAPEPSHSSMPRCWKSRPCRTCRSDCCRPVPRPRPEARSKLATRVRSDLAKFAEIVQIAGARVE